MSIYILIYLYIILSGYATSKESFHFNISLQNVIETMDLIEFEFITRYLI